MKPTLAHLVAAGAGPTRARIFIDAIGKVAERFAIDSPARIAAWLAQLSVESGGFVHLEENLRYRRPERLRDIFPSSVRGLEDAARLIAAGPKAIANRVYADRMGNGNEASGDGWRFRGRGLIQLTGRNNYSDAAVELGEPYIDDPGLVATPPHAALTAGWYWHTAKGNALADSAQIDSITRAIDWLAKGLRSTKLRRSNPNRPNWATPRRRIDFAEWQRRSNRAVSALPRSAAQDRRNPTFAI